MDTKYNPLVQGNNFSWGGRMKDYVFFRAGGFYLVQLESPTLSKTDDEFAYDNAISNPGTVKVEDVFGNKIFPQPS